MSWSRRSTKVQLREGKEYETGRPRATRRGGRRRGESRPTGLKGPELEAGQMGGRPGEGALLSHTLYQGRRAALKETREAHASLWRGDPPVLRPDALYLVLGDKAAIDAREARAKGGPGGD
jgi:hypothetical protein